MSDPTWIPDDLPVPEQLGLRSKVLVVLRGIGLGIVAFLGLTALLLGRLIEKPIYGSARPWTPHFAVIFFRVLIRIVGLPITHKGSPMSEPGVIVANHSSWLDIFALNTAGPLFFVSKSEVSSWPVIGWLARASGTVFISRDRKEAKSQRLIFEDRLRAGHKLLFFPEGTSSDGRRVLPFKPTLFAALFSPELSGLSVQPVSVVYHTAQGQDPRRYGWFGFMAFGPHIAQTLGNLNHGRIEIIWHAPLRVADYADRK
ncbi:1-acyl-sn-glycerol-3-phosphate acyltransferase, partial [Rhodobacteraceae bacterium]|nr:1-acyl-sn-glycerol-3-phosphate acyltransferase [Paracoccaceae bacterium]